MASFKDTKGREWHLGITHADHLRLKKELGVNVYTLLDNKVQGLLELLGDIEKLVDATFLLCERQAAKMTPPVTTLDFAEGLGGDALSGLMDAFTEALADFFPSQRQRTALRQLMSKAAKVEVLMGDRLAKAMEEATPEAMLAAAESAAASGANGALKSSPTS